MEKVLKKEELRINTENRLGRLAEITELVAENDVNIENICAYAFDHKLFICMITDDNEKAGQALEGKGYQVEKTEVLVISLWDRPGSLALVAKKLRENGISLHYNYGTTSKSEKRMNAVFSSNDNDKAMEVLGFMIVE